MQSFLQWKLLSSEFQLLGFFNVQDHRIQDYLEDHGPTPSPCLCRSNYPKSTMAKTQGKWQADQVQSEPGNPAKYTEFHDNGESKVGKLQAVPG